MNIHHIPHIGDLIIEGGLAYDIDIDDALWAELERLYDDPAGVIINTIAETKRCGRPCTDYDFDADKIMRGITINDWHITR